MSIVVCQQNEYLEYATHAPGGSHVWQGLQQAKHVRVCTKEVFLLLTRSCTSCCHIVRHHASSPGQASQPANG